ncbi:N-acetylmuramoyl-L-alanine amidase [Actinomadura decatromicini]|uniref:N-acetylmuramoyl-L-alanine amidase n=1 Tax=Actinomadura decatromicini TaxID=2604572 RepID=UPI001FE8EDA7|nr:N-acetylmuramoyl-L-alanine amidase [Actinomadura decatromicini]
MDIISRAEWGARAPRARSTVTWAERSEFVVHYSEGPTTQSVRSIQDFHMDDRNWADIGYNFLVDVDGRVYEGRGWLVVGAHAPGHNTSGIGVCMIGRDGDATPAAKRSIRAVYDEAVRRAGRSLRKLGHRDVYSTNCPGDQLYAWVRDGMPADDIEEDDMPDYVSVGMDQSQELPAGQWVTVNWGKEYGDTAHHHWDKGGPSLVIGPARYALTANVRVEGLQPGTELQARAIEHAEAGGDVSAGPVAEYVASEGGTFVHYSLPADMVGNGYRVRFQVVHFGVGAGRIASGSAKCLVWPT